MYLTGEILNFHSLWTLFSSSMLKFTGTGLEPVEESEHDQSFSN